METYKIKNIINRRIIIIGNLQNLNLKDKIRNLKNLWARY